MILCKDKPKSFKEFKELALMHKFGTIGFVLLFGYIQGTGGHKYRIKIQGTKRELAFKEAYRVLFTEIDDFDAQFVEVADSERVLKMPLQCNFSYPNALRIN